MTARIGFSLTADEVLKLRAAGVSDETIQKMLDQEEDGQVPSSMVDQAYATKHMGTWNLPDGSVLYSTGVSRPRNPTIDQGDYWGGMPPYSVNPFVVVPPPATKPR
jgi:hypothetical protein